MVKRLPKVVKWCIIMGESGRYMFYGQKEVVIDEKARLMLPSSYRDGFKDDICYLSLGLDNCLEVYPQSVYEKKVEKITSLNDFDPSARKVKRTFLSNTFEVNIDSHHRILLPKNLMVKVGIKRQVIVVGMFDRLEIWDYDRFQEESLEEEKSFADDSMKLVQNEK